jgi:dTDP-4-dehydrorhamnose reductase
MEKCMKKLLILGGTGMLGNAVVRHFAGQEGYDVTATYRTDGLDIPCNCFRFDALSDSFGSLSTDYDYVINCIGTIKPFMAADIVAAIRINAIFPHILADWCNSNGMNLIHITTDCVYSGLKGKYVESDLHDALDDYGKSKSLGECPGYAMVLRTSIIGEEIHKDASLIAWAKSQKGKTVFGFSTHTWNGVTTNQYAKICDDIIQKGYYEHGLFHVFAGDDVTKLEMMHLFNKKFGLDLTIEEKQPAMCDRTLRTEKELCGKLCIPKVEQMIEDM